MSVETETIKQHDFDENKMSKISSCRYIDKEERKILLDVGIGIFIIRPLCVCNLAVFRLVWAKVIVRSFVHSEIGYEEKMGGNDETIPKIAISFRHSTKSAKESKDGA